MICNLTMNSNMCHGLLFFLFCYRAEKYDYSLADYIQKDGQLRFVRKYMNSNILHEEILSYFLPFHFILRILTLEPCPLNKSMSN